MSKTLIALLVVLLVCASLIPFALIARSRAQWPSPTLALHLVLDMDKQPKMKAQRESEIFADGRIMRPRIDGTLAREDLIVTNEQLVDPAGLKMVNGKEGAELITHEFTDEADYDRVTRGQEKGPDGVGHFLAKIPIDVTPDVLKRGQERFNIYCSPCHGYAGYGGETGSIGKRATELMAQSPSDFTEWHPPTSLVDATPPKPNASATPRFQPDGQLFNTITNGIRNMPRYDKQISVLDRWAIVAYVRAARGQSQPGTTQPATQPASRVALGPSP